jgi:16S rRNA processing protein RimM
LWNSLSPAGEVLFPSNDEDPGGFLMLRKKAGPESIEDNFILVGRVTRPQALKGDFRVQPEATDLSLFEAEMDLWFQKPDGQMESLKIERVRIHSGRLVLKVEGIDTVEQAEARRGQWLCFDESDLPELEEDSFYYSDLIGCEVKLPDNQSLGQVTGIRPGAAGDLIVIGSGKEEKLIPAVREYVTEINLTENVIVVDPPEGLFE